MTLSVTGKLQDFIIFNKTKKFVRILLGERHKDFTPVSRIVFFFSLRNNLACVIFEGQRLGSTEFECHKVCELSSWTLSWFLLVSPKF